MKNVRLLTIGALLLLNPRGIFAQAELTSQGSIPVDKMTAADSVAQDQNKTKTPPPDYVKYDIAPEVVKQVQPDYPDEAMKKRLEGTVWLQLLVGEEGKVTEVKVQKSDAEVFNKAAIDAGMQWLFKPASVNGKPIQVWVSVPFKFKLMTGKKDGASTETQKKPPPPDTPYDKAPEAIKQVPPSYPADAKKKGLEGMVWLKVWIDESGRVGKVAIQKSDSKVFESAAIAAAEQWAFRPAMRDGKPVDVWVTIPIRFKLADKEKGQSGPALMKKKLVSPAEDLKVDKEPEALNQVNPKYPEKAMHDGIEGPVWTKMWIDESGNVVDATIAKSDNDTLNEAALEAGKQWKFKPALLGGKPVAVWITVPFRFKIAEK